MTPVGPRPSRPELAWFGGRLAIGVTDVLRAPCAAEAPELLDAVERRGGWWAVVGEYEGGVTAVRFGDVRPAPLPDVAWPGLPTAVWSSSLDHAAYLAACSEVRERIGRGAVYQVNVCRVLESEVPEEADVVGLAVALQRGNPAPYAGVVAAAGLEVVCASPELLLHRRGDVVTTGPIKGTATDPSALLPKDVDENVMIVDLARNDLSTVCVPGTVTVPELLVTEAHPGLVHLVSRVRGRLAPGVGWGRLWRALMPPASVTGAPKSSALRAIADLERGPRGPYCGAVGWIDVDAGEALLAVGIRTFWAARAGGRRVLRFGTGAGITWGSDPQGEWDETELKARRLLGLTGASAVR